MAGQARAGHAERVADGDGAAVDVVLVRVDAQLVAAVEALAGEGLVQLPKVDVVDLQPVAFEQLRHGEHRADAHLVGLAAGHGPALKTPRGSRPRRSASLASISTTAAAPSESWRGVAGGDVLAGPAPAPGGPGPPRWCRAGCTRRVDHVVDDGLFLGLLVDHLHLGLHRHDLVAELAGLLGGGHAPLGLQRIFVLVLAGDVVALGDDVGGVDHRDEDLRRDLDQLLVDVPPAHAGQGDRFDPAGRDHLVAVVADMVGGHGDRLQAGGAEAVDGDARRW